MVEEKTSPVVVPASAVKTAKSFVAAHGAPARAVVEHIGRAGARVLLVGKDGALGDVLVADQATAEALVEQVPDLELGEWDRETVATTAIGASHRRKMANKFWG